MEEKRNKCVKSFQIISTGRDVADKEVNFSLNERMKRSETSGGEEK